MSDQKVECYRCARFRLKESKMAAHGFGNCDIKPVWEYVSPVVPRYCQHHAEAPADVVEQRKTWIEKRKEPK